MIIKSLKEYGVKFEIESEKQDNKFKGLTFVITGSLSAYSRNDASEIVESKGGRMSSSVSKKVDYLIAGEAAGSKLQKAKKLNIKVLNESEFINMIKN